MLVSLALCEDHVTLCENSWLQSRSGAAVRRRLPPQTCAPPGTASARISLPRSTYVKPRAKAGPHEVPSASARPHAIRRFLWGHLADSVCGTSPAAGSGWQARPPETRTTQGRARRFSGPAGPRPARPPGGRFHFCGPGCVRRSCSRAPTQSCSRCAYAWGDARTRGCTRFSQTRTHALTVVRGDRREPSQGASKVGLQRLASATAPPAGAAVPPTTITVTATVATSFGGSYVSGPSHA